MQATKASCERAFKSARERRGVDTGILLTNAGRSRQGVSTEKRKVSGKKDKCGFSYSARANLNICFCSKNVEWQMLVSRKKFVTVSWPIADERKIPLGDERREIFKKL